MAAKASSAKPTKRPKIRFVIRKYVIARSVQEALKYERKAPIHEVFVSQMQDDKELAPLIGFEYREPEED